MNFSNCQFFVTCAKGTEGALRRELVAMRIHGPRGATGGVSFAGTLMDGMKVCLHARVAMRVLLEIAAFQASDADQLYAHAREVDWTDFVGRDMTVAVHATTQDNPNLRHSGFTALKVKDAIVDMLRDRSGRRPDVSVDDPDVSVVLHVRGELIPDSAIDKGLAAAFMPGRFQIVRENPAVILDGAHNREAAAALMSGLLARYPGRPLTLVIGMMGRHAVDGVMRELAPYAAKVIATQPGNTRAMPAEAVAAEASKYGFDAPVVKPPMGALRSAMARPTSTRTSRTTAMRRPWSMSSRTKSFPCTTTETATICRRPGSSG